MAAARRHVFVGKVLERLFPRVPHGQEKRAALAPSSKSTPEKAAPEKVKCRHVPPLTGGNTEVQPGRRLYTVSLPPEGYVPGPAEPHSYVSSENSSSSDDVGDQDPHDQTKRRRIRKPKSRKKCKNPNNIPVEQAELEKQKSLLQEKLQPRHTSGPTMSKNKKRKLKKKQQIKRRKAAGLPTGASSVSFTYQPEDSGSEHGDKSRREGEEVMAAEQGAEQGAEREGGDSTDEKADGILNFLKSTQEIYFYDGASQDADPVFMEAAEQLCRGLEARSVCPSDVSSLDHMKTLLLLQDTGSLRSALDAFPGRCAMPPDHARVISAFFNYWITHILPEKHSE